MKLLSCHIENFGILQDFHMDFTEGNNIILQENGYGKSTFAAFIKAMFYGFSGGNKRSIEDNERKKYKPWQGGVFGGSLDFEENDKEYRISRIFGDKEANDEFELRDKKTNLISRDYTERIGEEIFKINQESFVRTVFIGQKSCETTATDDINAKIGNLTENTNDLNSFDKATDKLTQIVNTLTPSRATGSLFKRKDEITKYERLVLDGQGIQKSIEEYEELCQKEKDQYDALKKQLKENGDLQERVTEKQKVLAKKEQWEELKKRVKDKEENLELLRQRFPKEIPSLKEVKEKIEESAKYEKVKERVTLYRLSDMEDREWRELNLLFEDGLPSEEEIDQKLLEEQRLREVTAEYLSFQLNEDEQDRYDELSELWEKKEEDPREKIAAWNNRMVKKAGLLPSQAALDALKTTMKIRSEQPRMIYTGVIVYLLLIFGFVLSFVGICSIVQNMQIGYILVLLGIIMILVSFPIHKKQKKENQNDSANINELEEIIRNDQEYIDAIDGDIQSYLSSFGIGFDENTVMVELQNIVTMKMEYEKLQKKKATADCKELRQDREHLLSNIRAYLAAYSIDMEEDKITSDLYFLKQQMSRFTELHEKRKQLEKGMEEEKNLLEKLHQYMEKYGFSLGSDPMTQLNTIMELTDDYEDANKSYMEEKQGLEKFVELNNLQLLENVSNQSLPSLKELNDQTVEITGQMEEVHQRITGYHKQLENLQEKYESWEEDKVHLEELKALQVEEQRKYNYVFKARAKLVLAKEALTAKYSDPILQAFMRYYEMLCGTNNHIFHVDVNTNVTLESHGKQREILSLSTGYRDLVGICLRLALIDAMYTEQFPFLVMDDPFTNLDDEKLAMVRTFLDKVSEKYQIIYFTCSKSRC